MGFTPTLTLGVAAAGNNGGAGSTNVASGYGCEPSWLESGPEYTYAFSSGTSGNFMVTLSNMTADLDVFVLEAAPPGGACVAAGNVEATWSATAGHTYYIVVDGFQGAQSAYSIIVTASGAPPGNLLAVGVPVAGNNGGAGSTNAVSSYDCMPSWDESGPEYTYAFTPRTGGNFMVTLSNMTADLDVFVFDAAPPGGTCVAAGNVRATWSATAGQTYYIVVDGFGGAQSDYTIALASGSEGECRAFYGSIPPGAPQTGNNGGENSTNGVNRYQCQPLRDESGPEYAYTFRAVESGEHNVTLSGMTADLDVFVLDADLGCVGDSCVAFGDLEATWSATAGHDYYIVVDGHQGAQGDYTILLTAPPLVHPVIALDVASLGRHCIEGMGCASSGFALWNGGVNTLSYTLSDDASWMSLSPGSGSSTGESDSITVTYDTTGLAAGTYQGTITITAPDANNSPVTIGVTLTIVPAGGECTPAATLTVGATVAGNNGGAGSTNAVSLYGCEPEWDESGPEYTYAFTAVESGEHIVALSGMSADLDVFVLDANLGCRSGSCIGNGDTGVEWSATAGHTYHIVVDGFKGAQSDYTIELAGPPHFIVKLKSSGTYDGCVLETAESSSKGGIVDALGKTFRVGDDAANKQYRSFLSFDTGTLPDTAVIVSAKLKLKYQGKAGTSPFATHGKLLVDAKLGAFSNKATLQAADFQGAATRAAATTIGKTAVAGWYSASLGATHVNRTGLTQLRLRFTKDDNNDKGGDYLSFYSGNASTLLRPVLEVEYYVP